MKKQILAVVAIMAASVLPASAGVKVNVAEGLGLDSLAFRGALMSEMITATRANPPHIEMQVLPVKNNTVEFALPIQGLGQYQLSMSPQNVVEVFANPDDNILVEITTPTDYKVSGTPLMDDINRLRMGFAPIDAEYAALMESGNATKETVMALAAKFEGVAKDFIKNNPESPATAYAMLEVEGQDFLDLFPTLSEQARKSPFYPLVEQKKKQVEARLAAERRRAELTSGTVDAPAFTLDNLEGKPVSISDFKGKWVVIDFWGSWCKWCLKGFPDLKKAYKDYEGKLEIIGVDNRDTKEAWKAAVERFKLPWVHVYNPQDTGDALLAAYCVEGFPTKAIISPEGKVMDITVGEDPSFFDRLAAFIAGGK